MTKQLQFLMLFAFIGLGSFQLNAQTNGTFNGTIDALWTNTNNWTGNTIADATGEATIDAHVALDGITPIIVGSVNSNNGISNTARIFSSGILQLNGSSSDYIIRQWVGQGTTFNCDVTVNINNKNFLTRNSANSKLIFADTYTLALGSNRINIVNAAPNPVELNGTVTGSGNIFMISDGSNGGVIFGASSDFVGYSGTFVTTNNSIISNTTSVVSSNINLREEASFTINVANTFEGNIIRNFRGVDLISTVTFNANQNNMGSLTVDREELALDFGVNVTEVIFSGYSTSSTEGEVDLRNYTNGVLRIGTTATEVSQVILDTWLIDGVEPADGTITQDSSGFITIPVNGITSTTGQDINWEDTTSWVGGVVPGPTDNAVILGSLIINSDVTINNLTIINDSPVAEKVTVMPGHSITVNGDAITRHNLYGESTSSSFSSIILNGSVSQNVSYNRYVNATPGNDLISAPIVEVFTDIAASFLENPANPTQKAFGPFNTVSGLYENWDSSINGSDALVLGKGYRAATTAGSNVEFKGEPASPIADITIAITDGGHTSYGTWNLIGNPFPSYLDFTTFFDLNKTQFDTGVFQAVYGYNGAASGNKWETYNNLNLPPDDKIAPGQGFFVKTPASTSGTVTFTPAMRTIGSDDDFVVERSSENSNIALAKLLLSNSSDTYSTDIYFVDNQTRGLDPGYDAGAYVGASNGIYTNLVENNTGIDMAIQALPYDDFNDVVVPLSTNGEAGIQLTIGIDIETVSIPSNINVYLEDNVTNTWTLLNTGDYVFTPSSALNGTGRFYVHFSNTTLALNENVLNGLDIHTEQSSKTVVVKGQLNTDTTAVIYDVQGRLVVQNALNASNTTNTINVNALKAGIYIVELKSNTQNRTQKIIIK
ncbi:T9SS type A sorting domain-containing protein [Winogradskyella helgolandensis]|uniref:T9SS type A sorting domain-containing protein n=1 Tax=Winogradskyella helgolandensis TaxID=2697010 RepID=UPI0015C97588|nr:T9SS type A sorting domain-containing protein [Winogradskyella helgolandensis]